MTKKSRKRSISETEVNKVCEYEESGEVVPKMKKSQSQIDSTYSKSETRLKKKSHYSKKYGKSKSLEKQINLEGDEKKPREKSLKKKKKLKADYQKNVDRDTSSKQKIKVHSEKESKAQSKRRKRERSIDLVTPEKEECTAVNSIDVVSSKRSKRKKKIKQSKSEELVDSVDDPSNVTSSSSEFKNKVISSRKHSHYEKERQKFQECRKSAEERKDRFKNLSLEEVKKKIADIESRETLSKSAKKKLAGLKSKLKAEENPDVEVISHKRKTDSTNDEHEAKKAKLSRKEKKAAKRQRLRELLRKINLRDVDKSDDFKDISKTHVSNGFNTKSHSNIEVTEQQLFIEDRIGDKLFHKIEEINLEEEQNQPHSEQSSKDERSKDVNTESFTSLKILQSNFEINTDSCTNSSFTLTNGIIEEKVKETNSLQSESTEKVELEVVDGKLDESEVKTIGCALENMQNDLNNIASNEETKTTAFIQDQQRGNNKTNHNIGFVKKQRYVLFVGNLAYQTTTVDLKKHFLTKVSLIKDIRIPLAKETNNPRGFAYVEVDNSDDFERALSLHGTFIRGRPIKVEYTGGSKQEIVHKNKKLHAMRQAGMLAGSVKYNNKRSFRRNKNFHAVQSNNRSNVNSFQSINQSKTVEVVDCY